METERHTDATESNASEDRGDVMEGIRAHKRKILMCKTVRAVTETIGVIGMATTWIGVSHMTNSSPALLPGATRIVAGLIIVTAAYIVNKAVRYAK